MVDIEEEYDSSSNDSFHSIGSQFSNEEGSESIEYLGDYMDVVDSFYSNALNCNSCISWSNSDEIRMCYLCSPSGVSGCIHSMKNSFRPIATLKPHLAWWAIQARVTSKSPMRTWSKPNSEGKLFTIDLLDETGEIRATAFGEQAEKFFDLIEENKIYFISGCQLKMANKKFCKIKNDYELTFTYNTIVHPCTECGDNVPTLTYKFKNLNTIQDTEPETYIDFIGIAVNTSEVVNVTSKTSKKILKKRDVTLIDQSMSPVVLTLWNQQAEDFQGETHPVVAVRAGKVTEFRGLKQISLIIGASIKLNPDIPETKLLQNWFNQQDFIVQRDPIKNLTISEGLKLCYSNRTDHFKCFAYIFIINSFNSVYKSCPTSHCSKKVTLLENGKYFCLKCNAEYQTYKNRLILRMRIWDSTGNMWVTMFDDKAEDFLGLKADDVARLQEEDGSKFIEIFNKHILKPYEFNLKGKMFGKKSDVTALAALKPDYKKRCLTLIDELLYLDYV